MKSADVQEWLGSPVTEAYFAYLGKRIEYLKDQRRDGNLVSKDSAAMFCANWELVGGLLELEALKDIPTDSEQIYEVFGVRDEV